MLFKVPDTNCLASRGAAVAPMMADATRASDRMKTMMKDVLEEIVVIYGEFLRPMVKPQLREPAGSYTLG